MDSEAPSQCASCGKSATRKCTGCKTNVYCGKECQILDWTKHKTACKILQLEKTLRNVAVIAYEAYLQFREHTWDTPLDKVVETEDAVITYDSDVRLQQQYFADFPNHLVKNERAKMSVLCMSVCNEPFAWMHNMLRKLMQGLRLSVEEVKFTPVKPPRLTTCVYPNGGFIDNWPGSFHVLLRVTHCSSKAQWAMDITGGQFGIYEPFWKWADYAKRFVNISKPVFVYSFGTNKFIIHELAKLGARSFLNYGLVGNVTDAMDEAISNFEKIHGLKLAELARSAEPGSTDMKRALLDVIVVAICNYKKSKELEHEEVYQAVKADEVENFQLDDMRTSQATRKLFEELILRTE